MAGDQQTARNGRPGHPRHFIRHFWRRVLGRAAGDSLAVLDLRSPRRVAVAFLVYLGGLVVFRWLAPTDAVSTQLQWGIAVVATAAIYFVALFIANLMRIAALMELEAPPRFRSLRLIEAEPRRRDQRQRGFHPFYVDAFEVEEGIMLTVEPDERNEGPWTALCEVTNSYGRVAYAKQVERTERTSRCIYPSHFGVVDLRSGKHEVKWTMTTEGGPVRTVSQEVTIQVE